MPQIIRRGVTDSGVKNQSLFLRRAALTKPSNPDTNNQMLACMGTGVATIVKKNPFAPVEKFGFLAPVRTRLTPS
jgi:hypothetical protein